MQLGYEVIGRRIRELRKEKRWTQEALAEKSGIEPSNLSHIERAATKLSLQTLVSIANALGVSADDLLYGNLEKSAHVSVKVMDDLLRDCSPEELISIAEILKTVKQVLRKNNQA